jgi:periplasmic copper chaperone A
MRTSTRTLLAAAGAVIAGAVAFAAPASADITVTPTQLTDIDSTSVTPVQPVQGEPARLAFKVTGSSRTASTTKVQVLLPEDTPIAEVYPLSAPDWAPALTEKQIDKPVSAIHGTQTDQVVTAITWTAVPGRAVKPGQSSVLQVEAGPMPAAGQIVLRLVQTYSDGTVTRSDATVQLSPPTGQAAQGHDAHGGAVAAEDTSTASSSDADSGSGGGTKVALIISVLVVGLLGGAVIGGFALPRLRRGAAALTVPSEALDTPAEAEEPAASRLSAGR